ncbi:MAG: mechanosensitive ion channel [Leptospira sp.]|jgi:small-conductance mechanosensitive channel|nr:mechanosensitive ion channel [Leptospira sp.]NCS93218.1 mechanosensitive ion channel [Leptospira sp.]
MKIFDFYLELNPVNILQLKVRSFSENIILLVYFVLFTLFIYRIILVIIDRLKPAQDTIIQYNRRKTGRVLYTSFLILALFPIIFSSLNFLPTVLGLAAAGIVISLKEVWLNLVGWLVILGSNGFRVGDRVQIDGTKGDVVNIGLTKFTLVEVLNDPDYEQSTNRLIHFPNNLVIMHKYFLVSERMDFVWDEFRFKLTINSNWEKAEEIANDILINELILAPEIVEAKIRELSKNYLLRIGKRTPIVYVAIKDGSIELSLRYLTPVRSKRLNRILISKSILKRFKTESDIIFEEPE